VNKIRFLIILLLFSFEVLADQNDKRLDELFRILEKSKDVNEMNDITKSIWKIWLEPNNPLIEHDFNQGIKLMQSGRLQESIKMFTQVIDNNPSFAEGWNKRATIYYLIGDFDSSVLDIKETLKLEPRHFGAMDGLGLIFTHLQEYENAIDVYDQMLKIFPYNTSTLKKRERLVGLLSKST